MSYHRIKIVVAAAALLLLGACGTQAITSAQPSPSPSSHAAQDVVIRADEMRFEPDEITLEAGLFRFALVNEGHVVHDLRISPPGVHPAEPEHMVMLAPVQPGDTQHSRPVRLARGTYEMYCNVPGHLAQGMKGTITVR